MTDQRLIASILLIASLPAWGAVTGSISGTITDSSGGVIPGAQVTVTNTAQGTKTQTTTDPRGFYDFPRLPVAHYDLQVDHVGFQPVKKTDISVDADAAVRLDLSLQVSEQVEQVTVSETSSQLHVETASTQIGEVVSGREMTTVALNGRSYTDLLALQPGIVPMSTQQPDSIVMAGVTVAIAPSGQLNPGNQSISGQREDANGYLVNGGDVKELMNGGTLIVPDLDSIDEFRVLTNNFDAEYGNYSGGIVNVVTKSGSNQLHGSAFEFLRNTDLDARNFFSPTRGFFHQNQFGGTVGGPIKKNKIFYFADYQGTRNNQGIDSGLISVPTLADRTGNLSDEANTLTGTVSGPYFANLLSQKLGYNVSAGEPYYTPGCNSGAQCVFPNATIPVQAWSAPAQYLLKYIPQPNDGPTTFTTGAQAQILRDDKASFRMDADTGRYGNFSGYYFVDDYSLNNPYPAGQGGSTVPGFNGLNQGRGQLASLAETKTFGPTTVNEVRVAFMRSSNTVGQPQGGVGPSLASQGFLTGVGTPGIVPLAPKIEGVENVIFNEFTMGLPITNLAQANNTWSANDIFSRVVGQHTLKAGLNYSFEQVNVAPNATLNGSFLFTGSETGNDFADFLIGVPSNYNQASSENYYLRHHYAGGFAQDSWRVKSNFTFNFGVRWDLMEYWSEKYNQIPTFIPGEQSVVYPQAFPGLVYVGDPGVPKTLVPSSNRFSPRLGLAWSPSAKTGPMAKILGSQKTSIRAGYGIYYSVIEGNSLAVDEPQPPYGLSYTSPGPPLFAEPFMTAANGSFTVNPFPLDVPPLNASPSHPYPNVTFSQFIPQAGMTAPPPWNSYPYNENYFFSIEREFPGNTLLSVSYVGSQAHHLLLVYSANPGNPAQCLSLSQPSEVAPGSATCGPFAESDTFVTAAGQTINGTRHGLGPDFANDDFDGSVGNSNYNALQVTLRHSAKSMAFLLSYTFSKSIDQASSISDPGNPYDLHATRALSAWNLKHNFVASYQYTLPLAHFLGHPKAAGGWQISGITRVSTGFPVTLKGTGDNSLQGSTPNGVNNYSLDLPDYNGQPLDLNGNPRNGQPYFNINAFSYNALGTPGNAGRRSFAGPGMLNFDLALLKDIPLGETRNLQFRMETFNTFNHTQFFGPASVQGDIDNALFGYVVRAASPRLMQAALKFTF
ncbi:MAG TPA: carboxypeptidase regulatory-like domain-containing protein [Bryobacteraceae bacterium]